MTFEERARTLHPRRVRTGVVVALGLAMLTGACAAESGAPAAPPMTSGGSTPLGSTPVGSTPNRATDGQLTLLLDRTLTAPHWFKGTDGKKHLVHELMLTNMVPATITLSAVDVRDAATGASLMKLSGAELLAATTIGSTATPSVSIPGSSLAIVWLDIPLPGDAVVPAAVTHTISVEPPADVPLPGFGFTYTGAAVSVDVRPPVVLGAPVAGPGWAAVGSCCDGPHRRAPIPIDGTWFLAQRFAIDFNQLDADNRPGTGDPLLPSSFPTFGQPVYAGADSTVAVAEDRYPDLDVGAKREDVTPQNGGGNRVVLDLGDGRYVVYAHLQKGSVAVRSGDRIKRGTQIGKAGSSGTGGGPHLHMQVTDSPSTLYGDGLPYVFDRFDLTGQTPPIAELLPYFDTLEPVPITKERTGPRRDELPLGQDVVTFPTPASSG